MANRYHVSPDGQARVCSAKKSCRYGEDTPHFSTAEDARTAYEASQRGSFSQTVLSKKAYEHDRRFTYEGAELDSALWTYFDGSDSWSGQATVRLVADGREYHPRYVYGKWSAEMYRHTRDEAWESMRGTRGFNSFPELARHVEALAAKRARQALRDPDLSDEEVLQHLREEKARYDQLDADWPED